MPPWTELREHLARFIRATAIWWVCLAAAFLGWVVSAAFLGWVAS